MGKDARVYESGVAENDAQVKNSGGIDSQSPQILELSRPTFFCRSPCSMAGVKLISRLTHFKNVSGEYSSPYMSHVGQLDLSADVKDMCGIKL